MINDAIFAAQMEFKSSTGKYPKNIYLGRDEMKQLIEWAKENQYIANVKNINIEGDDRPEVCGLFVYEVNSENHIACT